MIRLLTDATINDMTVSAIPAIVGGGISYSAAVAAICILLAVCIISAVAAIVSGHRLALFRRQLEQLHGRLEELQKGILKESADVPAESGETSEEENIDAQPENAEAEVAEESFMQRLTQAADKLLAESNLSVNRLCREVGMSRTVLYNRLKEESGQNVKRFIDGKRMEYIKSLIATTQLSFTEIAEISGFSSSRYFSTAFKNYTGLSPSQYREQQAEEHMQPMNN